MTLAERIASEIMDTIERERRAIKDDLVAAAQTAIDAWCREQCPEIAEVQDRLVAAQYWKSLAEKFAPPPAPSRFGTPRQ